MDASIAIFRVLKKICHAFHWGGRLPRLRSA
jgi:hypothetical protein